MPRERSLANDHESTRGRQLNVHGDLGRDPALTASIFRENGDDGFGLRGGHCEQRAEPIGDGKSLVRAHVNFVTVTTQ